MTGFGSGRADLAHLAAAHVRIEIRATNHRFLDLRVRLPRELGELVPYVEGLAREKLVRGRFEMAVYVEGIPLGALELDRDRAKALYAALRDLAADVAPGTEVPLSLLASAPQLFVPTIERQRDPLREAMRIALYAALEDLARMRLHEGAVLQQDLRGRLDRLRTLLADVESSTKDLPSRYLDKLKGRVARLGGELAFDGERLEQEMVLFADRVDVSEELVRLQSHFDHFDAILRVEEAKGRRLDFLLQEMAREVNTCGAKSPDAHVSHLVVEMKAEIERLREQVQNVE